MAKKFALVTGLYNIFNTKNSIVNNVEVQSYNINSIIPNGLVDKNKIDRLRKLFDLTSKERTSFIASARFCIIPNSVT